MTKLIIGFNKRDNSWFGKYKDAETNKWKTKSIPTTCKTREQAEAWFAKWLSERSTGVTIANLYPKVEAYWTTTKNNRQGDRIDPKTVNDWLSKIRHHVLPHAISQVPITVERFTPVMLIDWLEYIKSKDLATYTIKDARFVLKTFIGDARKKGWIDLPYNPVADEIVSSEIPIGRPKSGSDNPIHLSREQVVQLITCASEDIPLDRKVKMVVALTTGARDGELQALAWNHIDLKQRTMRIERQIAGRKNDAPVFKGPKKGSARTIPLHSLAVAALAKLRQSTNSGPDDPVFPDMLGRFWRGQSANFFRHDLLTAGLPEKYQGKFNFDFHATRRTFLTLLADAGVSSENAGILAGHQVKGVRKHYVASHIERFIGEIEKLPLQNVKLPWL